MLILAAGKLGVFNAPQNLNELVSSVKPRRYVLVKLKSAVFMGVNQLVPERKRALKE